MNSKEEILSFIKSVRNSKNIVKLYEYKSNLTIIGLNIDILKSRHELKQDDIDTIVLELIKKFSKLTNVKYKYDGNYIDIINSISSDLDNKISDDFLGQILKNYSKNN